MSDNPYWATVGPSVFDHDGRRVVNGGDPQGSARLGYAEMFLQAAYSYAIPSPETIRWVAEFSDGRPILERGRCGAGVDQAVVVAPPQKCINGRIYVQNSARDRAASKAGLLAPA